MPEPTGRGNREFLPSANQALAARAEGGAAASATGSKGKAKKQKPWPGAQVEKVTNRILMVPIELPVDLL
jgi:hypothetical protein